MIKLKQLFLAGAMAVAMGSMAQNPALYRPAVYPQQQTTVGDAVLTTSETDGATEYLFKNEVLDAKFVKEGTTLKFGGSETMNLMAGTELFTVKFGNGSRVVTSNEMTLESVNVEDLTVRADAVKGADHFAGKRLKATFTYAFDAETTVTVVWTADLRDGSHYIKTNLDLSTSKDVKMFAIIPMRYEVNVTKSGKAAPTPVGDSRLRGRVVSNDKIFALLDTPTAINTAGSGASGPVEGEVLQTWTDSWDANSWVQAAQGSVPHRIVELALDYPHVRYKDYNVEISAKGAVNVEFHYGGVGSHGLNICGVELLKDGKEVSGKYHRGFAGGKENDNVYSVDVQEPGSYTVRMYVQDDTETIDSKGNIKIQLVKPAEETMADGDIVPIQGLWSRDTTLAKDDTWSVGSVVGLMADGEDRRSVLAYLERERAVPWRPYPIYNSWYELNINRTNKKAYDYDNLKVAQTVDVLQQWKTHMFDTQGVSIKSFVWDDGWDKYGTWDFNAGFPNGFKEPDVVARQMCSAQGAWLGPCGGYDVAGGQRVAYWKDKGGCNLHNPRYYEVFYNACKRLCDDYAFNYFKFDGISQITPAFGPAPGTNGEEDAEGIINIERNIRAFKPDIFFNTTVGTWASTAWLNISDAVWRHHGDHGYAGTNPNKREQWITYRDQYIYLHYVKENPLMTINSMMSHGFMLSNYGGPNDMPKDYPSVLRELRCAFGCGSSQVELYADYKLLNEIEGGKLWEDMADLVKWQRRNADVLPDAHWVGGDPAKEEVYGWAAWNGNKAVLTLRNGKATDQNFTLNLRKALNIPSSVSTQIRLTKSFADQAGLEGLTEGQLLDIDTDYIVKLPASTVFMFDGLDRDAKLVEVSSITFDEESVQIPVGRAKAPAYTVAPLNASDKTITWASDNNEVATVNDGAITGKKVGTAHITATATNGVSKTITVTVVENKQLDLDKVIEEAEAAYEQNNQDVWGEKIIKSDSVFSSNASDSTEGTSFPLTDGSGTTYWHSDYHTNKNGVASGSHYLQVELPTAVEGTLQVEMMRRINNNSLCANDNPLEFSVKVSNTGADGDWTDAGNLVFPLGSASEPIVTDAFTTTGAYKYFRFYCTKTNGQNRGYFHVGDFQLKPLVTPSLNSTHVAAAEALQAALADARKLTEVTDEHIAALQQAFEDYKTAIGQEVTPPAEPSNYEWVNSDWKEASFGNKTAVADKTNFYGACYYDYNSDLTVEADGKVSATLTYVGGSHAQGIYGIQLIRKDGTVASNARALRAPSAAGALDDYKFGTVGGNPKTQTYIVDGVPAGTYTLRVWSCATNDEMTMTANGKLEVNVNDSKVGENTWDKTSWKIDNSIIPEAVKGDAKMVKIGVTLDEDKNRGINRYYRYLDKEMTFDKATTLTATVTSNDDAKTMELIGVELLKADGTLVTTEGSYDGHYGTIGQAGNVDNVYSLSVPEAGTYTVRVWASYVKDVVAATGTAAYEQPTTDEPTVPTYTITSARGTFFSGDEYVLNTFQTNTPSSVTDANKQWIYIPADEVIGGEANSYFFYNVGTDKFMSVADNSNAKLSVNADPTTAYYMWENGNANYGFTIGDTYNSVAGGTKVLNSTNWNDAQTGVRFWQCGYDDGNRLAIEEIGSISQAEYDAIVKRIKDYYNPVYTDTGTYLTITAAFKDGSRQVVYCDAEGLKAAPAADVPAGAITKFIVERADFVEDSDNPSFEYVLRADKKYLHWTSGDNANKSADRDGVNERYDAALNTLRFVLVPYGEDQNELRYRIQGHGTGSFANRLFDFTLNGNSHQWVAGNAGDIFDDHRTSYFLVGKGLIGDVANGDPDDPTITVFDVARLIDYLNGARPEGVKLDPDADCNGQNNLDDVDAVVLRLLKK